MRNHALLTLLLLAYSTPILARALDDRLVTRLEAAGAQHRSVLISGVDLGRPALDLVQFEPMQVWAPEATVVVFEPDGRRRSISPPKIMNFKGRVVDDPEALVFLSIDERHTPRGIVFSRGKQFVIGKAVASGRTEADSPLGIVEAPASHAALPPSSSQWTCALESNAFYAAHLAVPRLTAQGSPAKAANTGSVTSTTYNLRLAIETDNELYAAFSDDAAITAYLNNLVGTASVVFQRDLATSLSIGTIHLWGGGEGSDPWTITPPSRPVDALAELGTYWHTHFSDVKRSAVVFVSGKSFQAGMAWQNQMCNTDIYCGDTGSACGDAALAGKYAGAYAFSGSPVVTTTIPDPTLTVYGNRDVEYAIPSAADNFWTLLGFLHELGHVANGPHTHCVALSADQQALYHVTRSYVDECHSGIPGCYTGAIGPPPELGTIMSQCHNLIAPETPARASRYLFGKAGEPSALILPYLLTGINAATPDVTIDYADGTIPCFAGRTASVTPCPSCTYSWSLTGGTITSGTNEPSITFVPTALSVTATVSVSNENGCATTSSARAATSCAAVAAPTGVVATAAPPAVPHVGQPSSGFDGDVLVSWNGVEDAVRYQVWRKDAFNTFQVGIVDAPATAYVDSNPVPFNWPTFEKMLYKDRAYLYYVIAVGANTLPSAPSGVDLAVTTLFTDPVLTANESCIKAIHFMELQRAVQALVYFVAYWYEYGFRSVRPGSPVYLQDLLELRGIMNVSREQMGLSPITFSSDPDPRLPSHHPIRAIDLEELRAGVR